MSNLALLNDVNVQLATKMEFCKIIARSSFVPKYFQNKAEDVFLAVSFGDMLGLAPLQALQCIAVINGKPCVWGDGMLAICSSKPDFEYMEETIDEATMTAHCTIKIKNRPEHKTSFSLADAKEADLLNKAGPWKQYRKRMLQMRARGFALRDACAHHLMGIISREEAEDYPKEFNGSTYVTEQEKIEKPYNPEDFEGATIVQKSTIVMMLSKLDFPPERKEAMLEHYSVDSISNLSKTQAEEVLKYLDAEDKKLSTVAVVATISTETGVNNVHV